MPVMVDEVAMETPDRICFSIPRSTDLRAGFHDITFHTVSSWSSRSLGSEYQD
jgi:hypothetical protein